MSIQVWFEHKPCSSHLHAQAQQPGPTGQMVGYLWEATNDSEESLALFKGQREVYFVVIPNWGHFTFYFVRTWRAKTVKKVLAVTDSAFSARRISSYPEPPVANLVKWNWIRDKTRSQEYRKFPMLILTASKDFQSWSEDERHRNVPMSATPVGL